MFREEGRIGGDAELEWREIGYDDVSQKDEFKTPIEKTFLNTSRLSDPERANEQELDAILRELDQLIDSYSLEMDVKELFSSNKVTMIPTDDSAIITEYVINDCGNKKLLRSVALAGFFTGLLVASLAMSVYAKQWFIVIPIISALAAESMYLKMKL